MHVPVVHSGLEGVYDGTTGVVDGVVDDLLLFGEFSVNLKSVQIKSVLLPDFIQILPNLVTLFLNVLTG